MNALLLEIRELAAWDFDHPVDRGSLTGEQLADAACNARHSLESLKAHRPEFPICLDATSLGQTQQTATKCVAEIR